MKVIQMDKNCKGKDQARDFFFAYVEYVDQGEFIKRYVALDRLSDLAAWAEENDYLVTKFEIEGRTTLLSLPHPSGETIPIKDLRRENKQS